MADVLKAQKLKLANSRKRFKELQELKKKKNANLKEEENDNFTPVDSLTSSTHSSINETQNDQPITTLSENNYEPSETFFDIFKQTNSENLLEKSPNISNYFSNSNSNESLKEIDEKPAVDDYSERKTIENSKDSNLNQENLFFPQQTDTNYIEEALTYDDPEIKQNDLFEMHNKENLEQSNVESLNQLSKQLNQLIEPMESDSSSITDLEKRNLELASLLDQEKIKTQQNDSLIADLRSKINDLKKQTKDKDERSDIRTAQETSRLKEELQFHIQTIGVLVAEKTELTANLSRFEFVSKQKTNECQELQARLKTSRSRVADLEREVNVLKTEKTKNDKVLRDRQEIVVKLETERDSLREKLTELTQDLLEVGEKLKNSSEENVSLRERNQDLSKKLSLDDLKIQQLTSCNANGNEQQNSDQTLFESLKKEKFDLEKQISNLDQALKTITKERDESSCQYQQYAQQLNAQLSVLAGKVEQLQTDNESLLKQEQNRVKHIGELERKLQEFQTEQVYCAKNRRTDEGDNNDTRELCVRLQIEKSSLEERYSEAREEKEMLLRELAVKNDSLSQLESLVERFRGNQPDSVKLLATMESDKVAAARAVQQNKELKQQTESMQEVIVKLNEDKLDLTEKLNKEVNGSRELLEKLRRTEIHLQRLTDAIDIKDRELSSLRDDLNDVDKRVLSYEQLEDRLRHYESTDSSLSCVRNELKEAKQLIVCLGNEVKLLKNGEERSVNDSVSVDSIDSESNNEETDRKLDEKIAMKRLEEKVKSTMQDIADLTEEKQRLEHLVLQLQSETETIGEYVALYQQQRMILKQKAVEKDQQLKQLANDRENIKTKLEKLNELIKKLVDEKGVVPDELLKQHEDLNGQSDNLCEQHLELHDKICMINRSKGAEAGKDSETAIEIIELLSEIKSSSLVQPTENVHHCAWCSGQLMTV